MRKTLLMMLCFCLFVLSSCWDARELSEIGIVVMTGFDLDENGLDRVTVISIQPLGEIGGQANIANAWIGTATGESLFDAFRNLRSISTRVLNWSHNKIFVIGEEKAKQGIEDIADILSRNRQLQYDSTIFLTTGRAEELLRVPANIDRGLFGEVLTMVDNTREWSKGFALDAKEFAQNTLIENQQGFVIGYMNFFETDKLPFSTNMQDYMKLIWKDTENPLVFVSGGCVVKNNRLIGHLSPIELRGYLWLNDEIETAVIVYKEETVKSSIHASVEILDASTSISVSTGKNNALTAKVELKVTGNLTEKTGEVPDYGIEFIKRLEKSLAKKITGEMEQTLDLAQNHLRSDFIGFYEHFSRQNPKEWEKLKSNWCEVFCSMPVIYDVQVKVVREGLISRTVNREGR